MNKIKSFFVFSILLMNMFSMGNAYAMESEKEISYWHDEFFAALFDEMYCVSELNGKIENYNATIEEFRQLLIKKLDEGFNPVEEDEEGRTPLMYAAMLGYPPLIEELLKRPQVRANIDSKNAQGLNALDYAMQAKGMSEFFVNPSLPNDMNNFITFNVNLSYYAHFDSDYSNPYSKSVSLLKSHGAQPSSISLKERMSHQMNKLIQSLTERLAQEHEEDDKKTLLFMLEDMQEHLDRLQRYQEGSDFGIFCVRNANWGTLMLPRMLPTVAEED